MGSVSPAGTAPGGLLGCPEHRSGSHQPFLLVSPLVQDRNRQSPEVPSSRMCTRPSASSSPSSTTRQVRVPFCRWRWPAATSWGEVSPQPHLSVLCWRIYTLYLLQHLSFIPAQVCPCHLHDAQSFSNASRLENPVPASCPGNRGTAVGEAVHLSCKQQIPARTWRYFKVTETH